MVLYLGDPAAAPVEPPPPPSGLILPGLYNESIIYTTTNRVVVTQNNTVIENISFTQATAESQVHIQPGVRGVIIRNCKFANSGTVGTNGAAITQWWGSDLLVHNCHFEHSFRAVHSLGGNGIDNSGDHSVRFILNTATDLYRNLVMVTNCVAQAGSRILAYNEMTWKQGNFAGSYPAQNPGGEPFIKVADGFASYATDNSWQLGNKIRTVGVEADPDTNGATYSAGDSGGNNSTIDRNFSWNGANNCFQVSSGSGNKIINNIGYHDGTDLSLQAPSGGNDHGAGYENSWITNRGLVWQAWGGFGSPTNGHSDGNIVFYRAAGPNGGADYGFTLKDGSPFPTGNDPLAREPNPAPSNWNGVTGPGTPQQVWDEWWVTGLGAQAIQAEGLFGAVIPA